MTDFSSSQSKIARAKEHLKNVELEITSFFNLHPNFIAHETDPKTGEQIWKVGNEVAPVPTRIGLIVGDCLHNFRSALDHLVWELASVNGGRPTQETAFPLCKDIARIAKYNCGKVSKLKGLSEPQIAIIDELQPANGGNIYLWWLHRLDITDKHRHLNLMTIFTDPHLTHIVMRTTRRVEAFRVYQGVVNKGTILLRTRNPEVQVNLQPTFEIAFNEWFLDTGTPAPVLPVLNSICTLIDYIFHRLTSPS